MQATQTLGEISGDGGGSVGSAHVDTPKVYEPMLAGDGRAYFGWLGLLVGLGLALRALLLVVGPINAPDRAQIAPDPVTGELADNLLAHRAFGWTPLDRATARGQAQPSATAGLTEASAEISDRSRILRLQHQAQAQPAGAASAQSPSSTPSADRASQGQPFIGETFELPGYPAFLALGRAAGLKNPTLAALQCLLSVGLGIGVFAIGYALMRKPGPALLAAAIVLLHPSMIVSPLRLADDVIFAALIVLGLWAATRRTGRMAVAAGLALALAGLVRPMTLLVGPAIGVWMIAFDRRKAVLAPAMGVTMLSLIGPGLWMVRNSVTASSPGVGLRTSTQPVAGDARRAAAIDVMASGQAGLMAYPRPDALDRFYRDAAMDDKPPDASSRITYQPSSQSPAGWTAKSDRTKTSNVAGAPARVPIKTLEDSADKTIVKHPRLLSQLFSRNMLGLFTADSLGRLYRVTGLGPMPPTTAHGLATGRIELTPTGETDLGAEALAWGRLGLGAIMLAGAGLGLALLVVRRQWQTLALVVGGLGYLAWAVPTFGAERLQVVAVIFQALLIATIFARNRRPFALTRSKSKKTLEQRRDHLIFQAQCDDDSARSPATSNCVGRPL